MGSRPGGDFRVHCPICGGNRVFCWWHCHLDVVDEMERRLKEEVAMAEKLFETKDSGERVSFSTGMVRDVQKGKARFDLIYKPLLWRWAELMGRGAEKYGERNWEKAATSEEFARFAASAERHLQQFLRGDTDEDHAAAVLFNLGGALLVQERLNGAAKVSS